MSMNQPSQPWRTPNLLTTAPDLATHRVGLRGLVGWLPVTLLLLAVLHCPAHAQSPNARFRGEPVTLNFVNADIEAVSRAMSTILKQPILVDPRVKGNITLYSEQAITPREAYLNYLAALRGLGFTVVEVGDLFKVVPEADAKLQASTVAVGDVPRRGDQIITQIFKLNHENANNLVAVLRPLISPNNTINANPGNNSLVITDYADNLERITKIIAVMDTPAAGEVEVIPLKHAVASDIATLVQRLAETSGGGAIPGVMSTGAPTVLVDARSNSLLVRSPSPARMVSLRSLVDKLDRPTGGNAASGNIWVVYLKNADAVKLAAVLRAAYAAGINNPTNAAGGGGGGSAMPGATTAPNQNAGAGGTSGASPQSTAPVVGSAAPSTGGFIQADPATNSLIITAPEPAYRQLRAVIDQLDSRRAQVYIESMIVKVDAEKAADIGFQWQGASINGNKTAGLIGGTNFPGSNNIITLSAGAATGGTSLSGVAASPPSGLNVGLVTKIAGAYTLGALARFMETNLDANVLSTPNLVALDNEEAKIVIGQNVPFVTGSLSNSAAGTANPFQTIERKDVGLTLRVKPQIGEDGTVRLTIYQENSNVVSTSVSAGPTTDKSSIETIVVVDDGQIMVLGGLLKDEFSGGANKVPLLGDLPLVGGLFRSDNRNRKKSNLMVFLRPVVIRDQRSADSLTMDRYDAIRALQKESQPGRNGVMPVGDAPVLPPLRAPQAPASATLSTPAPTPEAKQ